MQFTAVQIATILQGKIDGNENATVANFAKIEEAKTGDLCFLANPKYTDYIYTTQASIAIVNETLELKQAVTPTLIRVKDAYSSFAILLQQYENIKNQAEQKTGIEQPSYISPSAKIEEGVYIAAFAYISDNAIIKKGAKIHAGAFIGNNVTIGENTIINAGVKVYKECIIGNNCIIHAGTVVGSDGFGFAIQSNVYQKVPQIGNVVIEDDVEIGANCTLDRATMGSTFIRKGVKLDNLVQIAHNVDIGANSVIAGLSAVAGSTKMGENCMLGGQSGIIGHLTIADGTKVNGQSGVNRSIFTKNTAVTGTPALEYKGAMKSQVIYKNLPTLQTRIDNLEKKLAELTATINK